MAEPEEPSAAPPADDIKPYKLHVSSKYLDLTRQKLELTRLPREISDPKSNEWWEPKARVEQLIDYWLENYSWRDRENQLNESLPQFRTAISIPTSDSPLRIHFVHVRSPHDNAVPLLLIPPFPFTNLSLGHLVSLFTDPDDAGEKQPFHLVIPSLPGVGLSDALPNNTPMIATTAQMLDVLMARLDYKHYLASNSGPASNSPSKVDWQLARHLATHFSDSCIAVHLISPPLSAPRLTEAPSEWIKWIIASLLGAAILGYSKDDFVALRRAESADKRASTRPSASRDPGSPINDAREPNTLAYALCDSPTGLLLFVLMILRTLGSSKQFSQSEILTLTELTWLPGPEATLRFWAHCATDRGSSSTKSSQKPKVGVTVFLGDERSSESTDGDDDLKLHPRPLPNTYACPSWGNARYQVISANRIQGEPSLLAWERPEIIAEGIRGLSKQILAVDKRLQKSDLPGTVLLEQVVVGGGSTAPAETSGTTMQVTPGSSSDVPPEFPAKKPISPMKVGDHLAPPMKDIRPTTPQVKPPTDGGLETGDSATGPGEESEEGSPDTVIAVRSI